MGLSRICIRTMMIVIRLLSLHQLINIAATNLAESPLKNCLEHTYTAVIVPAVALPAAITVTFSSDTHPALVFVDGQIQ